MTANLITIARPYARAAFEFALEKKSLPAWSEFLQTASVVARDPMVVRFMASPLVIKKQLADLFCDVLRSTLDTEKKNFIFLLSEHKRLPVLPEIAVQFQQLCAEQQKTMTVDVHSAVAMSAEQKEALKQALTKRFHLQITLDCSVHPELIGGVMIRAGDVVIDGSVRGKLNRLVEFIS